MPLSPMFGRSGSVTTSPVDNSFTPPAFRPLSMYALTKASVGGPAGRNVKIMSAPESLIRCMIGPKSVVFKGHANCFNHSAAVGLEGLLERGFGVDARAVIADLR